MAWVVQFKWERKKVEYGYYEREREREKKKKDKKKKKREKRQQFKLSSVIKKKK